LFEELVFGERESVIENLSSKYAFLKAEFSRLDQEKTKNMNLYEE